MKGVNCMSNKTIVTLAIIGGAFGYLINKRVTRLENQIKINDSLIKESETKPAKVESKRGRKPKTESK